MFPIFDLHCHPSLKIYLCGNKIHRYHPPAIPGIPIGMDVDLYGMRKANVQVAFCSHYIPEAGFRTLPGSTHLFNFLRWLGLRIMNKFEDNANANDAFTKMHESMQKLNKQIDKAAKNFNVVVAKNLAQFEAALKEGKTIIVHSAEGSHQLGRKLTASDYLKRLYALKAEQGLALLTIGHFFTNDICDTGGGIPPKIAKAIDYRVPAPVHKGLSETGKAVMNWCQEEGVIVDLVHTSEKGRQDAFELLNQRRKNGLKLRPVVFSHTGVREVAAAGGMSNPDDLRYLPSLAELKRLQEYGGVLGLILFDYWINGAEEFAGSEKDNLSKEEIERLEIRRISDLLKTIRCIYDHLGDYENISIGTDMDGFTHVPDDIRHIRFIGKLRNAITKEFGEGVAKKICYENALRVIRHGWS